jgi:DNA-binding CsgD family transcriptional regulator
MPAALTRRQDEVLRLAAAGLTAAESARRMGLSVHTVRRHRKLAYRVLGARNKTEAATALWRREQGGEHGGGYPAGQGGR